MTTRKPGSSSLVHEAEPLVTVKEVAALLHVSTETVLTWVRTGRLAAIRTPGGHPRFHAAQIRALLQTGEPGPTGEEGQR
ncbi:helix-turn-helix domain-containing protein [Halostreptopolyspora alba]|uniref:Helix-turn-helix domain-containing protein n=1 Tax=Halostreptopolyspora alba TaxID=2487137 RepID=A0A3N0E7Q2_9ACTN|nr:helix-turn-helix domain-containing protein [Nocardiopsaceae bacterium YIM 96095]